MVRQSAMGPARSLIALVIVVGAAACGNGLTTPPPSFPVLNGYFALHDVDGQPPRDVPVADSAGWTYHIASALLTLGRPYSPQSGTFEIVYRRSFPGLTDRVERRSEGFGFTMVDIDSIAIIPGFTLTGIGGMRSDTLTINTTSDALHGAHAWRFVLTAASTSR